MTDTNVSSLVLKKGSNRYIFDPSGNLDLSNYYTKSEADGKYALKTDLNKYALTSHTHSNYATTTSLNAVRNIANSKASFNLNNASSWVGPLDGGSSSKIWRGRSFSANARLILFVICSSDVYGNIYVSVNGYNNIAYINIPEGYSSRNTGNTTTLLYNNNQSFTFSNDVALTAVTL